MTSIAIINRSAPYGSSNGQESLDFALAAGSFGQDVSLFFVHDGVFQLVDGQQPELIEHKKYSKTFSALAFYDVENIYVCLESLAQRNLQEKDLCINVKVLDSNELNKTLAKHKHLVSF